MPQYCQDKIANRNNGQWGGYFGRDIWIHFHHFCYGLIYYSRASIEFDDKSRRFHAKNGITNFNYVLGRWPASSQWSQQAQMYKTQLEMMRNW